MVAAGAVAAFTPGVFGLFFARRDAFEVGIAIERICDVLMTTGAELAADVIVGESWSGQ